MNAVCLESPVLQKQRMSMRTGAKLLVGWMKKSQRILVKKLQCFSSCIGVLIRKKNRKITSIGCIPYLFQFSILLFPAMQKKVWPASSLPLNHPLPFANLSIFSVPFHEIWRAVIRLGWTIDGSETDVSTPNDGSENDWIQYDRVVGHTQILSAGRSWLLASRQTIEHQIVIYLGQEDKNKEETNLRHSFHWQQ